MFKVLAKSSLILHFDIRRGRQPWRTLELRRLKAQLGTCTTPPSRLAGGSSAARVAFITSPLQEKGDEISPRLFLTIIKGLSHGKQSLSGWCLMVQVLKQ